MSSASTEARSRSHRSLAGAAVASLLILAACGGGDASGDAGGAEASTEASAETRESGESHSHEGGDEHSHEGEGAHTHPAADTLAPGVALSTSSGEIGPGSATVLAVGDSVRILVSVEGVPAGSRHPVELVAGSCEEPGAGLTSLTPVAAGTSGKGSSQTTFPTARLGGHAHGAVRVLADDGATAACAPVHLATSEHTHD